MKKIVGLFFDNPELKLAVIEKYRDKLNLIDLFSVNVAGKIKPSLFSTEVIDDRIIEENVPLILDSNDQNSEEESHLSLLNFFYQKYKSDNLIFIPSVTEPHVSHEIVKVNGLPSKELKQKLFEKWARSPKISHEIENLRYVKYSDNTVLSIYSNEYFPVLQQIDNLAESVDAKRFKIPFVTSADVAITDYIFNNYEIQSDKTYLIIHLGIESTRMIFIIDGRLHHLSDYLSFGSNNYDITDVLVSKVSFEMDNAQIPEVNNIFLCGEVNNPKIQNSFAKTFPLTSIEILQYRNLDTSQLPLDKQNQITRFALPIAAALNYINPGEIQKHKLDLSPKKVKELQKVNPFNVLGYAILLLLFAEIFFMGQKFLQNQKEILRYKNLIESKQLLIASNDTIGQNIAKLKTENEKRKAIQFTLDTLTLGAERWTDVIKKIQNFELDKKNMWITNLALTNDGINIKGASLSKKIIPEFSLYLNEANVKNILNQKIRNKRVNIFEINAEPRKFGVNFDEKKN